MYAWKIVKEREYEGLGGMLSVFIDHLHLNVTNWVARCVYALHS